MKRAIQFGAGNIGRGFIGAVLSEAGYHVVFADVNMEVIDRINKDGAYTVHIMDVESRDVRISNISGVDSGGGEIVDEIVRAEIITTAVGLRILPFIAPAIAKGIAARRAAGQVTTYYVCCSHRYPNMFTFSDPAEATVAAWYAVANGYDGFLRWAYNSWTEDPLRDSRFRTWPAGDTYVIYPGGRSSIRFERLREGIQDAEKIRILRAEAGRGNSAGADEKRARLEAVIAPFASREPAADLHERLAEAKRVLNEL